MTLKILKEIMDLCEKRGGTRDPGQRPKSAYKKIKGELRDKKRRLRTYDDNDNDDGGDDGGAE